MKAPTSITADKAFVCKWIVGVIELGVATYFWRYNPVLVIVAGTTAAVGIGAYVLELHSRLFKQAEQWRQEGFAEGLRAHTSVTKAKEELAEARQARKGVHA